MFKLEKAKDGEHEGSSHKMFETRIIVLIYVTTRPNVNKLVIKGTGLVEENRSCTVDSYRSAGGRSCRGEILSRALSRKVRWGPLRSQDMQSSR